MRPIIAWFVHNPVAANLLMLIFVGGGLLSLGNIYQEEFPAVDTDMIRISVPYLGASPAEAEEAVCTRIEEKIDGTNGIDRITSLSYEGMCTVTVELLPEADGSTTLNEVKGLVDSIDTFPEEAEKPIVSEIVARSGVIQIAVSGDVEERTLKRIGQTLRDDIAALPEVSQVDLRYARPDEMSIEVSEHTLRRYGLTLSQIADAIRQTSLDMPGGSVKTGSGEILLRTKAQAYEGREFADIVVLTRADGTEIRLGDIAEIIDGFEDSDLLARFDGKPAVVVKVYRIGKEDTLEIAEAVRNHVKDAAQQLPDGVSFTIWSDESQDLMDRLSALNVNAFGGLLLVLFVLTLFLRFHLAMWVAAGIPIAILGALILFPPLELSISTMTVMSFILVLGIVVDDAIVVGERVYAHERHAEDHQTAAIAGTYEISVPVIFGVFTTMAAFLPLLMLEGRMGSFFSVIGTTVIICLVFSLLESQLILPSHLAHRRVDDNAPPKRGLTKRWTDFQERLAKSLEYFAEDIYQPFLRNVIAWRYLTLSIGIAILILVGALFASGRIGIQFFPSVEGNRVVASLTMPQGTPIEVTEQAVKKLEAALEQVRAKIDAQHSPGSPSIVQNVMSSIGARLERNGPPDPSARAGGAHIADVGAEMLPYDQRDIKTSEIAALWREATGTIPDAVNLNFNSDAFSAGTALAIQLNGKNIDNLRAVAEELKAELGRYDGVYDIADSFLAGKQEVKLQLRDEARPLGLTEMQLARQVRQGFYGEEAQRVQRGVDDMRIMVRYPEAERRSLGNMENMWIRTADGMEVPFSQVAAVELGRGYATINRTDRKRTVTVTANVDRAVASPEAILATVQSVDLPKMLAKYPGVSVSLEGEQRERIRTFSSLPRALGMALMIIFALLAIPLRSYLQPLVIMSVIPFGAVGAIFGHFVMDFDLVFFSVLGIVALSGVVVNSSLVMVDYINRQRRLGVPVYDAVAVAGVVRFRPIFLTSVTTFIGLTPLMFNTNPMTIFMVPMGISLAFGVLFATAITLILVPCLYLILEDVAGKHAFPDAANMVTPPKAAMLTQD